MHCPVAALPLCKTFWNLKPKIMSSEARHQKWEGYDVQGRSVVLLKVILTYNNFI